MKATFTRVLKGISKYFVFSMLFIVALFTKGEEAGAATPRLSDIAPNITGVGTSSDSITPIGGTLSTSCVGPVEGNYLAYEILGSTKGDGTDDFAYNGCVSYTTTGDTPEQVFYIQAVQSTYTQIRFRVSGLTELHHYVTVFEDDFSLSEDTKYDYDQYELSGATGQYVYSRKVVGTPVEGENGALNVSGEGSYIFEFTYTLRDAPDRINNDGTTATTADGDEYGQHNLYVYFYDADPDTNNSTKETKLSYTLAKPISEYENNIVVQDRLTSIESSTCYVDTDTLVSATNAAQDQICILYAPNPNTGGTDDTTKTNKFVIKASNNIAFYFSTVNTHKTAGMTIDSAAVKKHNTIYATNAFENSDGSDITYNYFNAIDGSTYDYAITTKANDFYKFTFTIDASGNYTFTLMDIFGNTVSSTLAAVVEDVSNRTLSTYYIKYAEGIDPYGNLTNATGVYEAYGPKENGDVNEGFELKDNLSLLTNENVIIGLEFYYKVDISGDYAVSESGNIKKNPLPQGEIRFDDGTDDRTYYCRMKESAPSGGITDSYDMCVAENKGSNYTRTKLNVEQIIEANATTGLKKVENKLNAASAYVHGVLDTAAISAVATRTNNRVSVQVNENGRFYVRIQDTHGNSTYSTIDVSIIDQLNPVITFNGDNSTLSNVLCSSMYVIGGGGAIQGYPTGVLTECSSNSVTYNHFDTVDTSAGTEKYDEIRLKITRPSGAAQNDSTTANNGFYNTGSSSVVFNYADAIRMALLKATDSISVYNADSFYKSVYRMVDANTTYTEYGIYTYKDSSGTLVESKYDFGSSESGRSNLKNDYIISHNYIQYSSELYSYFDNSEYVWFDVYTLTAAGTAETNKVCSSQIDDGTRKTVENCYKIVNAYIDKGISFVLEFFVRDYVGNVSVSGTKVTIDVVDDTTPGILEINEGTGEIKNDGDGNYLDPVIAKNNIDTTCRLEIGSSIQNKNQLLKCYGLLKDDGSQYYFVDNATTYQYLTVDTMNVDYYNHVLFEQLYNTDNEVNGAITFINTTYAANVNVYVCSVSGAGACSVTDSSKWVPIPDTVNTDEKYKFVNAGDYEIKFEISDSGRDYAALHTKNTTTIIACYYVNPRILLVRPLEDSKVYGTVDQTMHYCIYATTNTNAFFYNLFNLPESYSGDTYKFIQDNYESSLGIVYCTNDPNPAANATRDGATKVNVSEILANNDKASLEGILGRTYATGENKYNMELEDYNAYEDAGYYYFTLGTLKVKDENVVEGSGQENYIVRLHPNYLLDGMTPHTALKSYNHADLLADAKYKYGTAKNTQAHGETVSNVLFTIKQAQLTVNANGGEKVYGNTDTNYKQAYNTNATNNISEITTNTSTPSVPVKYNPSVSGYLNGFTIEGLITTLANSTVKLNDYNYVNDGYNNIISGYLRRDGGENVGKYYICNNITTANNTLDHSVDGCDLYQNPELNVLGTSITLTGGANGNVYSFNGTNYTHSTDVVYGRYVGIDYDEDSVVDVYYKLTRNNSNIPTSGAATFNDALVAELWRYNYDDSNYSLKIVANPNNNNQNYYMVYNDNVYTIKPAEIIVQPGINQGKEYSNPEHNDPIFELVVYGEKVSITSIAAADETAATFNGYTQSIAAIGYPHEDSTATDPYLKTLNPNTYSSTANGKAADTEVYFSDRRTTSHEVTSVKYVYEYDSIAIVNSKFTLPQNGVNYTVSGTNICVTTDISECIASGGTIGAMTLTIKDTNIIVTIEGYLTYQDYKLFTSDADGANPGSATITRASGSNVGWYSYVFDASKLHVVSNASNISQETKNYCSHTNQFVYSVDGTDNCVNYNVVYTANAAVKVDGGEGEDDTFKTSTTASADGYLHNGNDVCTEASMYSVGCANAKKSEIQFLIFKRDVIVSLNAQSYVYGQVYSYFANDSKTGKLDIKIKNDGNDGKVPSVVNGNGTSQNLFTCYRKAKVDEAGYMAGNGKRYYALSIDECNGVDYGISSGDVWGEGGVNLQFYLHNDVADVFVEDFYSIPAGLYFVYAGIGTNRNTETGSHGTTAEFVHDNYNLVYIDYDILVTGTTTDGTTYSANTSNKNGALEITPRAIKLQGTYYQKEFGQALYEMYDENGEELNYTVNDDGTVTYSLDNAATIKIFDNHYYYCEEPGDSTYNGQTIKYGCKHMEHTGTAPNYLYSDISNVYLYTVIDDGVDTNNDSSFSPMLHAASNYDEIIANFAGAPVRLASGQTSGTDPAPKVSGDAYGLLDDAGYYTIYLGNIIPVVAQYYKDGDKTKEIEFSKAKGTIFRDENYSIAGYTNGLLYITPGQIDITVTFGDTSSQTKMYGCSYNTVDFAITDNTYSYADGYDNCVETVGQYYDLGYEYVVSGDKANHLKNNTDDYLNFNACADLDDRETPSGCNDITYTLPAEGSYNAYKYKVTPNYGVEQEDGTVGGATGDGKPSNTSLNTGTLYRINADLASHQVSGDATKVTYDYATYFGYATNAQLQPTDESIKFQEQKVGTYAITLGNLDAAFNSNRHCNANSAATAKTGAGAANSLCKNFIVVYGGNNTSKHTNSSDSLSGYDVGENEVFTDAGNYTLTTNSFKFTIQKRNVVMTTEYNYKVYGDTDPNEGFTCSDLTNMFTYPDESWYGTEFSLTGRTSYCANADTFIHTGVVRFYAIDNSLAKAPWTAWVDNGSEASTYYLYNDALYDVISSGSKVTRKGENTSAASQNDAVGKYALEYVLSLSSGTNANGTNNYVINYLSSEADAATNQTDYVKDADGFTVGFAADIQGTGTAAKLVTLDRWYRDGNHKCIMGTADGSNFNIACNAYTGSEVYRFQVDGIAHSSDSYIGNKYYATTRDSETPVTGLKSAIYFEIVRREIFVQTLPVVKDYGIEEEYTDFEVNLCSEYNGTTCTPVSPSNEWGVRNSLSIQDYKKFYGNDVANPSFNQVAFKGSDDSSAYRGGLDDKAFGIYMYRTYGENVGEYVIVACPTQYDGDLACRTYYHNEATNNGGAAANDSNIKTDIGVFTHRTTTNAFNASNYIVKTIPSKITINVRHLYIIPDANQGFMYGNYETGDKIAPITYKEAYASGEGAANKTIHVDASGNITTSGLVNGSLKNANDHVNNQIAICIYDISSRLTCINDRQNDNDRTIVKYVTTGLHDSGTSADITTTIGTMTKNITNALDQSNRYGLIQNNIYNDTYGTDEDTTRNALNRKLKGGTGTANEIEQRYNRNVGTYTITQGELTTAVTYCDGTTNTTDCLNTNYAIYGFKDNVDYVISPATILVTPKDNQSKTYGYEDVHLTFDVTTIFTYHDAPNANDADRYYCNHAAICQDKAFSNQKTYNDTTKVVTLNGFAYTENVYEADNTTIHSNNYGNSKISSKKNTAEAINSGYDVDSARYYDKYCLRAKSVTEIKGEDGSGCIAYTDQVRSARVEFEATSRILLGYFYVDGYYQQVGTHAIRSGITVAKNEYGVVNYLYKAQVTDANVVAVGADTGKTFTINQLDVTVTIQDITKVYGQATDSYKCDSYSVSGHYACTTDNAILQNASNAAFDNEGRLEYNFDVTGAKVDKDTDKTNGGRTILAMHVVHDKDNSQVYYTETGNAEYKNIHLGLTVVRAINAYEDGTLITCGADDDKFGCEDAGEYVLVFRKQAVTNSVDANYNIKYGTATSVELKEDQEGYATVVSTTKSIPEKLGDALYSGDTNQRTTETNPVYTVYKNAAAIDDPFTGQNSSATPTSDKITIVSGYSGKLTITKRDIMFYIGTYDNDSTVTQRFVIEQNEQVPVFPKLNDYFTTSSTSPVKTKQTHFVTWFDINEYGKTKEDASKTYAPRQVRTSDEFSTSLEETVASHNDAGKSLYGIYICANASTNIQGETYDSCTNPTLYSEANKIANNEYVFDTSQVGDYALVRNKASTYIKSQDYEAKNYVTEDYNGTLVIFADQTAPEIQVGNDKFVIEANADTVSACTSQVDSETVDASGALTGTAAFSYNCTVVGKLFDEVAKVNDKNAILGQIIKYLTLNFSGYDNVANLNELPENSTERDLPASLATLSESWIYQPVNNIGIRYSDADQANGETPTTLYDFYRSVNTYDFDTDYIDSKLEAITSIISWFNINSYDYSYIRGEEEYADYISKRYTPRYYFYVSNEDELVTTDEYGLSAFDPTYVGDFTVTIYVIDDVGNQSSKKVTLSIVDTTKPETGELHVFNSQVECSDANCKTNTIESWTVKAGYVPIDAFVRYKKNADNTTYTEDNTNGIYIKLNGTYVNIYSDEVSRYDYDGTNAVKNILGGYVLVEEDATAAIEVEHKYWSDTSEKYIVVVGGKDNSFIDLTTNDVRSQWNTYYATNDIDGWYMYSRHANIGTPITFKDGATSLYTRVLDSGRYFTLNSSSGTYTYYNNIYLRYVESGSNACDDLDGCVLVPNSDAKDIAQVTDAEMTQDAVETHLYTFKIHSIIVTYNSTNSKVTWPGLETPRDVGSNTFSFGIMTCTIDMTNKTVDCSTEYTLVYNEEDGDKVELAKPAYSVTNSRNIGDWDSIATDDGEGNPIAITRFYKDRRYILVDTKAPTLTLSGEGYSIYEFDEACAPAGVDAATGSCKISYREHFIDATDTLASSTSSGITATAINNSTITGTLSKVGFGDIVFYTGKTDEIFVKSDTDRFFYDDNGTDKPLPSGFLVNSSLVNGGNREFDSDVDAATATEFNKHKLDLEVYLTATSGNSSLWYKYTAIYNGTSYYVYRQAYNTTDSKYNTIETFAATGVATRLNEYKGAAMTTIEDVLQFIVSTASVPEEYNKYDLTYSINYVIRDAANNASVSFANVTIRGVTYTRLSSTIYVSVPEAAASLMSLEDEENTYSMSINQGASLANLLNGFAISNVNNKGINNMATVMQTLYYNGEVLFENVAYNTNILSIIDSYGAPGTYTLKLTSTREVVSEGETYIVNDDPLTINFVVNPALAHVETHVDYSNVIVPLVMMAIFSLSLFGIGYVTIKKKKTK